VLRRKINQWLSAILSTIKAKSELIMTSLQIHFWIEALRKDQIHHRLKNAHLEILKFMLVKIIICNILDREDYTHLDD
jgi:hypothetical protein